MVVDLVGVGMSRPGRELLDNVDLTIHQGDRVVSLASINRTDPHWLIVRAWRGDDPLGGKGWPGEG